MKKQELLHALDSARSAIVNVSMTPIVGRYSIEFVDNSLMENFSIPIAIFYDDIVFIISMKVNYKINDKISIRCEDSTKKFMTEFVFDVKPENRTINTYLDMLLYVGFISFMRFLKKFKKIKIDLYKFEETSELFGDRKNPMVKKLYTLVSEHQEVSFSGQKGEIKSVRME
jgi:hypothetical protein